MAITLRMYTRAADWLTKTSSLKCYGRAGCSDSPVNVSNMIPKLVVGNGCLSTVLAQDHFFSDFLSLHLTTKTHKESMMMLSGAGFKTSTSAHVADLMTHWSPPQSEWFFWHVSATHQRPDETLRDASISGCSCKLTWLVLGEDPAARSHRVEQFTAL